MVFIFGFLGALLAIGLLFAGVLIGWQLKLQDMKRSQQITAEQLTEAQKRRLVEEREAWEALHNYSAADAYGVPQSPKPGKE